MCERARLGAGVGGEQQLDLVDARGGEPQPPVADPQRPPVRVGAGVGPRLAHVDASRACGIASASSSPVTSSAEPGGGRGPGRGERAPRPRPSSARSRSCSARSSLDPLVGVVELEQPRAEACSAQASTSSIVSPYLRVSAVSAARRSETAASRAGSVSSREA